MALGFARDALLTPWASGVPPFHDFCYLEDVEPRGKGLMGTHRMCSCLRGGSKVTLPDTQQRSTVKQRLADWEGRVVCTGPVDLQRRG